jgi:hypothetical protein
MSLWCVKTLLALSGRGEVSSRMSALRGEANMPRLPAPYQCDATDPKPTCGAQDLERSIDVSLSAGLDGSGLIANDPDHNQFVDVIYFAQTPGGQRRKLTLHAKKRRKRMIKLIAVAGFALAIATSAQAMTPAPIPQLDGMITQVAAACGAGRTRVNGVCVARTTIRHTRRAVRRSY